MATCTFKDCSKRATDVLLYSGIRTPYCEKHFKLVFDKMADGAKTKHRKGWRGLDDKRNR